MLSDQKAKAQAALKRLDGLSRKVAELIEDEEYCVEILRNVLAMKGHLDSVQAQILESHLHTCGKKNLSSEKDKEKFIKDLLQVIGLSKR